MEKNFTISSALRGGWEALKPNFLVLVGLMIGYTFVVSLITWPSAIHPQNLTLLVVTRLITMIIGVTFSLGYLKMCLEAVDGNEPTLSAFPETFRFILPYLVAAILATIVIALGLILLIIPGLYIGIRLQFFPLYMIEGEGMMESIKKSWNLTKGNILKLALLFLICLGIFIAGLIVFIVGALVSAVWCQLIITYTYRLLLQDQQESEQLNLSTDIS